jgi:penicillin-binding protein 1A
VALEAASGDVLAWVGGRDFRDSRFDRVRAASRQTGSAFKPFVYSAALESGQTLTRVLSDEPLLVRLDRRQTWEPRNYEEDYDGLVTLRDALVRSKNVPTVRLAAEVGYEKVAAFAERAGFVPPIPTEPSMALGTVSVSPLELTAAYTAFARLGTRVAPRLITRVDGPDGVPVLSVPAPQPQRVLGSGIAYLITDVLSEAVSRGTGASVRAAGFGGLAAGKTGTTSDGADAWFVGYTPDIAATVWIGFDDVRAILPRASGARLAAPAWGRIMARLYKKRPAPGPWMRPADVAEVTIDGATGFAVPAECALDAWETRRELFQVSTVPTAACPSASPALLTLTTQGMQPLAPGSERMEPARSYVPFDPNPDPR